MCIYIDRQADRQTCHLLKQAGLPGPLNSDVAQSID